MAIHSKPGDQEQLLEQVRTLLNDQRPREALVLIAKFGSSNDLVRNAYGVCLMRTGEVDRAVEVYRDLCIERGVSLKRGTLPVQLANYATALLLQGNLSGCLSVLRQLRTPHPAAERLRGAIARWGQSLPWLRRLGVKLGAYEPRIPVDLGFPPGDLE